MKDLNKLMAACLTTAVLLIALCQESRCDVIGDTYSLAGVVFNLDSGGAAFVDNPPGFSFFTFDGTSKVLGDLAFGNAGDQAIVTETQTVAADGITFTATVSLTAQDSAGNLTTWVAPGTTFDDDGDIQTPEVPFDVVQLNLGTGAGLANDTLDVDQAGFNYTFVSSSTLLLLFDETDPTGGATTISFGEGSGLTGVGGPTGQLSGGLSTSPGADVAEPATNPGFGGLSVAGLGFTYTYTLVAVPEPSSAAGLMFFGLAGLVFRRRK